jgi:hypothetical protein
MRSGERSMMRAASSSVFFALASSITRLRDDHVQKTKTEPSVKAPSKASW